MNKRDNTYYLSYSIDDTGSENYRVAYATGATPFGPFTAKGLILSKDPSQGILGTGHSSIIQIPGRTSGTSSTTASPSRTATATAAKPPSIGCISIPLGRSSR